MADPLRDKDLDAALRRRLSRLLAAAPGEGPVTETMRRPVPTARPRLIARTPLGVTGSMLAVVVIAVGAIAISRGPSAGGPITGMATDGDFRLTINVPHSRYPAGQAITGIGAVLEYAGSAPSVLIGHARQVIGFAIASADGRHQTEPAWAQSCGQSELSASAPATAPFTKSGGYWPEESDYPWLKAYFENQSLVLERGEWTITAVAEFSDGTCGGRRHELRASASIEVVGTAPALQPASTGPSPSPSGAEIGLVHFEGDGFGFDHPADWRVLATSGHVGLHGPTLEAAVGIGDFDLGCTSTSTSVSCPADPIWSVPHNGVILVYRFEAWLGMCAPATAPAGPPDQVGYVGGRAAHITIGERSMTWEFPGAPELIEARWGDGNEGADAAIEELIRSWTWSSPAPGCPLTTN